MKKKYYLYILVLLLLSATVIYFFSTKSEEYIPVETSLSQKYSQDYVGSDTCKECHSKEYHEWKQSDHFKAMQLPNDSTILGDFNNVTYTADGITSRFFQKNGKYYINTQDETGNYRDFEVIYTFGYYPLQQYLTAFEEGRLQVFRQSWDSRTHRWFHQYEKQKIPHEDWLHWTGNAQNWNMMCATCHTTNYKKNYDAQTDTYHTTYSEGTVGCETCHGAGKSHISFVQSSDYKAGKTTDFLIELGTGANPSISLNTCFPCHSRRGELMQNHIPSSEILDNYIPEIPASPLYFADGQAFDEVYKYASFLQSKMYQMGVKCIDCHSPHTGKLKAEGDKVCMQCHTSNYATSSHTFHKENTEASDCRNCHMPVRTYMGNDVRHDHNFAVPRPDLSEKYDVPNACNQCHTKESAQWARKAIEKWYGTERKPHFAEDLIKASKQDLYSLSSIEKLLSQPETPDIIRATTLHYLGGIPSEKSLELIIKELKNPDAQTRYRAVTSLMNFPINFYQHQITELLNDKVRAVRIASANVLLAQLGIEKCVTIPNFENVRKELETFLLSQADFAVGSASAGDYYAKMGEIHQAITFYQRAIKKDNQLNYVRLNLAMLLNQLNQNDKALEILQKAKKIEPNNPQIYYYLALLYSELEVLDKAKENFEKAIALGFNTERLQRNYHLLLEKMKNK